MNLRDGLLLPNWQVLTVDANNPENLTNSELYKPARGNWISGGSTIVNLPDIDPNGGGTHEMGPQLLRPNGTVFAAGATGHTAVFDSGEGSWTVGPDFPIGGYDVDDGPAALLSSGKVLIMASPGVAHQPPAHFFLFDGSSLQLTAADPKNAATIGVLWYYNRAADGAGHVQQPPRRSRALHGYRRHRPQRRSGDRAPA
jgi:hypothetical protein